MKMIEQAINIVYKIDDQFFELYDIIRHSYLDINKKREILEQLIEFDMILGEIEKKLKEINKGEWNKNE